MDMEASPPSHETESTPDVLDSARERRFSWRKSKLGGLSEAEFRTFQQVWVDLKERKVQVSEGCAVGEEKEALILRFLRANQFNAAKTTQSLEEDINWRIKNDVAKLRRMKPKEILGCEVSELLKYYPHAHVGFDDEGRPVIIQRYGGFEVWNILKLTTLEAVIQYHIWEQERNCALLAHQSLLLGTPVENFCMVIDVKDMGMNKITREFLNLMQRISEVDQKHYPERLGVMYIINTPSVFPLVWKGVKPWLDVQTTNKIQIISKPSEWQPVLLRHIGSEMLPTEYGGTGLPLIERGHCEGILVRDLVGASPGLPLSQHLQSIHQQHQHHQVRHKSSRLTGIPPMKERGSMDVEILSDGGESENFEDAVMLDIDLYDALELEYQQYYYGPRALLRYRRAVPTIMEEKAKEVHVNSSVMWSDRLAQVFDEAPILCSPCRRVLSWDIQRLSLAIERANVVCILFAIMIIAFGIYVIANMYWISELVDVIMWLAVIIVCLGVVILLLSFVGYLGLKYRNRLLLNMYVFLMTPISIALLIVAFICFASASPTDSPIFSKTWERVAHSLSSSVHLEDLRRTITQNSLILAAGSLCVSSVNFVPCVLGIVLALKLRHRQYVIQTDESHLRVVLRASNYVTTAFGIVCILYGAYATHTSMRLSTAFNVFTPFLLMQAGIVLIIVSVLGFWVSRTESPLILAASIFVSLPLFILLIVLGVSSFDLIGNVNDFARSEAQKGHLPAGTTEQQLASASKATLIVQGILEIVTSLFQCINIVCVFLLRSYIKEKWERFGAVNYRPFKNHEYLMMAWALMSGLTYIFFDGSYVVFAQWLTDEKRRKIWFLTIFEWVGQGDQRYFHANSFIVSMGAILACVVGPSCFLFAWSMYSRKSYTNLLGITLCTVSSYSQALYYATEIANHGRDSTFKGSSFWLCFIIAGLLRLVLPLCILLYLLRESHSLLIKGSFYEMVLQEEQHPERLREDGHFITSCSSAEDRVLKLPDIPPTSSINSQIAKPPF